MLPEQFIQEFCTETGITDLAFSEEQTARLVFDEDICVDLEWQAEDRVLYVHSSVGLLSDDSEALCREMLSANHFGRGTGGASLSLGDDQQEIILARCFETETLIVRHFADQLEAFVDTVADWMDRLSGIEHNDEIQHAGNQPGALTDGSLVRV